MLIALLTFSSCSNEDEPTNLADNATGTYSGYTVASCAYFSNMASDNQTLTITSSETNKVNIKYVSDTWGTITVDDADLSGSDSNILVAGSGKTLMGHAGNEAKEYDCTVEGTIVGKTLSLTFSCPTIMGGLKIEFKQGDVPAEVVVSGTYSGYTEAKSTYFSGMMTDDQTIVVTKNSDDTFTVSYTSDTWGEFTVDNAKAVYSNGSFTLTGSGVTKMGMDGNVKEYDCTLTATIDVEKNNPTFTFSVPSVMGGLEVVFHTGDMPATEE